MEFARTGEVITFYSYKGGTGRSMALANVAGLLAQEGKRVLAIDWDLEAPGLHRYFANRTGSANSSDQDALPGVVDLMWRLCEHFEVTPGMSIQQAQENARPVENFDALAAAVDFNSLPLPVDCGQSATGQLHFLKAGSFNEAYSRRVNTLPWEPLFYRAPGLFDAFAHFLESRYDYALVDSRTGLTDISGICTMLMPQKLVVVFTPNRQSLDGVLELARRAIDYRMTSSDVRPIVIFPLASRIDNSETDLRVKWRQGDGTGYQPRFEKLMQDGYRLDSCNLESYFDAAQIPHNARFSYGERIAVLEERVGDSLSLAPHYARFKERLVGEAYPWEDPAAIVSTTPWELMDRFLQRLDEGERAILRDTLTRLVRPAGKNEGKDALLVYPAADLPAAAHALIPRMERARMIAVAAQNGRAETIQLAGEEMPRDWSTLREWIDSDREFLLWRDSLRKPIDEYRRNPTSLSSTDSALLADAPRFLYSRAADLTAGEMEFLLAALEDYRRRSAHLLSSQAASELQRSGTAESAVRSALLAAESLRRLHTMEADQTVRDALAMIPPLVAKFANAHPIAFLGTRADRTFVACTTGNDVRFWLDPESKAEPIEFHFQNPVTAMAASSDAKLIATCDDQGAIFLIRDFGLPEILATAPPGRAYLEFDYEDRLIAILPFGGLCLVEVENGVLTPVMPVWGKVTMHRSSVDRKLFFAAADGATECWVWHAGNPGTAQRIPLDHPCTAAAFSNDNRQIAVAMTEGAEESIIGIFDLDSLSLATTHRLPDQLNRLIFSPGDLGILAVTGGRTAQTLPVRTKTASWRNRVDSDVSGAAANARVGMLALGGADGLVRLIDFSSGREVMRGNHGSPIGVVRFNANGERLVTAGGDASICIWDVRALRESMRVAHSETVWDVQFHPSGAQLVTVGNDMVQAVDLPGGKPFKRLTQFGRSGCSSAFSPDGSELAVTLTNGQCDVLSWPGAENLARYFHKKTATCCSFSPDGAYLATGGIDGRVMLIPRKAAEPPTQFEHADAVWDVRFDPTSKWLVSGDDRGLRIWNVETKGLLRQILLPAACHSCVYTPDGQSMVAACDDGICRVLSPSGDTQHSIRSGSRINCVAVSPDGRHMALGADNAVKIWSMISGEQIAHIRYDGEVQWLAFSPDSRHLAAASSDTTARLWLWRTCDLIEEVERRVGRKLTPEDWASAPPLEIPGLASNELELAKMVSAAQIQLLASLSNLSNAPVALNGLVLNDVRKLMALGLVRSTTGTNISPRELSQQDATSLIFELTPRGREFVRHPAPTSCS